MGLPCPITKTILIHWIFFVMLKNNSLRHCDVHQCFCLTLPAYEVKLNLIFNIRYDPFFTSVRTGTIFRLHGGGVMVHPLLPIVDPS